MNINISTIISKGERVTLECKKAQRSVPNSLWETYSAFANTYGGTILLSVVKHMEEQELPLYFENGPINYPIKLTERQSMILQDFHEDKTLTKENYVQKKDSLTLQPNVRLHV